MSTPRQVTAPRQVNPCSGERAKAVGTAAVETAAVETAAGEDRTVGEDHG